MLTLKISHHHRQFFKPMRLNSPVNTRTMRTISLLHLLLLLLLLLLLRM